MLFKSVFNYAETCNVYYLPISSSAIFRTCMLYIGLIGFRNGCVQLSETKQINFLCIYCYCIRSYVHMYKCMVIL